MHSPAGAEEKCIVALKPDVANLPRIQRTVVAAIAGLVLVLLAMGASGQPEDPQTPPITKVTGSVTTFQDGAPVISG